jgi:hypothetical protein
MTRFELDELNAAPEWRSVLAVYREWGAAARNQSADFDGWLPRLNAMEGIESARLPIVHGRLIALGFLRFQVGGRSIGLQYQLTPEGRQALESAAAETDLAADCESLVEADGQPQAA